jgi:hypothetical protein
MLIGLGNAAGVTCTQSYHLQNRWNYKVGSYSQVLNITAASP